MNSGVFYGPKDQIRDPICKLCRAGVNETVEHIIIRCTGRQFSRRKYRSFYAGLDGWGVEYVLPGCA